jgi:hypothetical protein
LALGVLPLQARPCNAFRLTSQFFPGQQWAFAGTTDSGALNFEESFNFTTTLLHAILIDRFFPGQPWAFAGTTDSEALNFKESFNLTTTLLHSIPVDKFFPGQPWAQTGMTSKKAPRLPWVLSREYFYEYP